MSRRRRRPRYDLPDEPGETLGCAMCAALLVGTAFTVWLVVRALVLVASAAMVLVQA